MKKDERILHIAKGYNNISSAERYFYCEKSKNMRDRISHKQFLTVFRNLNFDSPGNKTVALDAGCSSGRYMVGLKNKGFDAVGLDTAIIPLKYASERVDEKFIRASATDLPFKKDSFDLVICIELLHHFEDKVLENVLEEISDIIKSGGIFVFDVKNKRNPVMWYKYKKEDNVEFTLKARTNREMRKLVEKYGFEVIKKKGILFPITLFAPYVVVFGRKKEV
ncbi:MAG: class I SAM-dependent methyltransferase [Euryarchaeota archaeon]|nr:class I SAM-dependent methyltransferase [Euryarchaeota archaeon]